MILLWNDECGCGPRVVDVSSNDTKPFKTAIIYFVFSSLALETGNGFEYNHFIELSIVSHTAHPSITEAFH